MDTFWSSQSTTGVPGAPQRQLPDATWAPHELSGDSLELPGTSKLCFLKNWLLSAFLAPKRLPGAILDLCILPAPPRPTLPLYLLEGTIYYSVVHYV